MILRGTDFGPVWGASGVTNFFDQGWPQHTLYKMLGGLDFSGMTFVAKTMTLHSRPGNMPLHNDLQPKELIPKSIYVNGKMFLNGHALNAVGLSGPGSIALFEDGRWQKRQDPFLISYMAVATTPEERITETKDFVEIAKKYLPKFSAPIALQVNFSCPNVEHAMDDLEKEAAEILFILKDLQIPLVPKFSVTLHPERVVRICAPEYVDGLCISNTVPWGQLPENIHWHKITGKEHSPLTMFGGGGLSGKVLLPLVAAWIQEIRALGFTKPINAGGGVLSTKDVDVLFDAGADSIFIGTAAIIRWWRVQGIIRRALHHKN